MANRVAVPDGVQADSLTWARTIFSPKSSPTWVRALFAIRQALVGFVGIRRGRDDTFQFRPMDNGEALAVAHADHLDFAASIQQQETQLLVLTAVQLHNLRGRLYFKMVRLFHGPIVRAMMRRAVVVVAGGPK